MSKRRKNAGEGYGYMFSGAFAKKADAVKKEKTRKGSFIKTVFLPTGMRYAVMTPRTNPIKRNPSGFRVKKSKDGWILTVRGEYAGTFYEKSAAQARGRDLTGKENRGEMIKRRLAELGAPPQKNPTELMVLGANPGEVKTQEIKIPLPGGGEVTIRSNPEPRQNIDFGFLTTGWKPGPKMTRKQRADARREHKARVRQKTKEEREYIRGLAKSARESKRAQRAGRVFHEVFGQHEDAIVNPAVCGAKIGGYTCTRKPNHKGPHLPQGATMRTRTRLPHSWQPRTNPDAASLRERFTGMPVDSEFVVDEPHMPKGSYAQLGEYLALYVKPLGGGQVQVIKAGSKDRPIIVSDESARQLYFVGGDQDVSESLSVFGARERGAGIWILGDARRIDYKQRKEHIPHPEHDEFQHAFGEETNELPTVLFDANAKRLLLEGGAYSIREEGIIN